ncbi:membrane protein [Clostridium sardiniense]
MKKLDCKQLIKKLVFFFLGVWIIQIGVAIFIGTNIGSDPFTVFTQGLAKVVGITPGIGNMIITFTFLVIILIFARHYINIGTVLAMISAGPFIDLMIRVFRDMHFENLNIVFKMILLVLSCVIIAIGFSLLKATELGVAPNDVIPFLLSDKSKLQYRVVRIAMDITFFVVGYLLGGVIGIGTVIAALLQGPLIQFFMPRLEKFVHRVIYTDDQLEAMANEIAE